MRTALQATKSPRANARGGNLHLSDGEIELAKALVGAGMSHVGAIALFQVERLEKMRAKAQQRVAILGTLKKERSKR